MTRLYLLGLLGLLSLAVAAPASNTTSPADQAAAEEAVKSGPVQVTFLKPADTPILATSNKTVVDTNPVVQAKVSNAPAVLSSITAAAPHPTASPTKRAVNARQPGPTIANPIATPVPVVDYVCVMILCISPAS